MKEKNSWLEYLIEISKKGQEESLKDSKESFNRLKNRGCFTLGIPLLILLTIAKSTPAGNQWMNKNMQPPENLVVIGLFIAIFCFSFGIPGCGVFAVLFATMGGILYYQKITGGDMKVWIYMWTLIPLFGGIGIIQETLFNGDLIESHSSKPYISLEEGLEIGTTSLWVSIILFIILAEIFSNLDLSKVYGIILLFTGTWLSIGGVLKIIRDR